MPGKTIPPRCKIAYLVERSVAQVNRSKILKELFGVAAQDSLPDLNCRSEYQEEEQEEPEGVC